MAKKPRIKDVAARAEVAPSTVSFVLNGDPRVAPATRARVLKIIEEMNYRPNPHAKSLGARKSRMIAFASRDYTGFRFVSGIVEGAVRAATAVGMHLVWLPPAGEEDAYESMFDYGPVGVICPSPEPKQLRKIARRFPRVVVIERPAECDGWDFVGMDNVEGGRLATQHLVERGHRRIACLTGPFMEELESARTEGYRRALDAAGVEVDSSLVLNMPGYGIGDGEAAAKRFLESDAPPTAFFANSDLAALGILRYCRDKGIRVPEDVSVVGFDDVQAEYGAPPVTTIAQPFAEYGRSAVRLLNYREEMADEEEYISQKIMLAPKLVERASTGPAPADRRE
jgi:LacI family transcriptional regulator